MQIRSNALLKYVVPLVVLVMLVLGLRACQQTDSANEQARNDGQDAIQLTEQQMQALGIEAESPEDTVDTLVAQMYEMQNQLAESQRITTQLRQQNKQLAQENQNLQSNLQGAINKALAQQRDQIRQSRQSVMATLSQRLESLRVSLDRGADNDKQADGGDMPVGLGLNGETPAGAQGGLTWVNPLEARAASGSGDQAGPNGAAGRGDSAFSSAFNAGRQATATAGAKVAAHMPGGLASQDIRGATASGQSAATPVYTVPKNSTLAGSVSMTALLGRVPIQGTVQNPYPFKVIIGRTNLITNGIKLPEIKGAIVSGHGVGDWTLSCVRGTVESITFVFADGRVRTVPEPDMPGEDSGNRGNPDDDGIGYLSNPQGLPCIPGTRETNARKFLLTQLLLSTGAAAAGAVAGGETTTAVSGEGAVTAVTGDIGRYIAGKAVSQGINDVRKWVQKRFGQTFDAVYVPPGQPVVVNITQPLPIDYEHNGRKVNYVQSARTQALD